MATKAALLSAISAQLPSLDSSTDQLLSMTRGGESEPADRQQAQIAPRPIRRARGPRRRQPEIRNRERHDRRNRPIPQRRAAR